MDLWILAGIVAGCGLLYFVYDSFYLRHKKKKLGKLINIILFEKVGKDLKYMGNYLGEEKYEIDGLGAYINLGRGLKKTIERVSNDDYIHDEKFGKALQVIKFSDDDYRPLARLKEEVWYKNEPIKTPIWETDGVNEETGDPYYKFDSEGNKIQMKDDNGLVFDAKDNLIPFKEPFGVSQSAREAMRFSVAYAKKMAELKKSRLGLLEKFAPVLAVVIIGIILMIAFIKMSDKLGETQMHIADTFKASVDGYTEATKDPMFAETVMNYFTKKDVEENAPPK